MTKQTVVGNLKDIIHKWYYTEDEVDELLESKADLNHVHDYITEEEIAELLESKAPVEHTHYSREVVDLRFVMSTKAEVNHTHSEYYRKETIDAEEKKLEEEIANIIGFRTEIVEDLDSEGKEGVVYLKPKEDYDDHNIYDEYIYINGDYEKIGSTDIKLDLSPYVTQESLENQLSSYSLQDHTHSEYETRADAEEQLASKAANKTVTATENGLMPSVSFNKLAGIEDNANHIDVDDALNPESENPVQNKAITEPLTTLQDNYELLDPKLLELQKTQSSTVEDLTTQNHSQAERITELENHLEEFEGYSAEKIRELEEQNKQLQQDKTQLETEKENLTEEKTQLETEKENLTEEKTRLEGENKTLTDTNNQLQSTITSQEQNISQMTSDLQGIRDSMDNIGNFDLATATNDGLMSKGDFVKLQGVAENANHIIVDAALNNTSVNPVQNKAIQAKITSIEQNMASIRETYNEKIIKPEICMNIADSIAAVDSMMKWDVCNDNEVCFYLLNGAPSGTRISLYKNGSQFCQWGDSHPTVYYKDKTHSATGDVPGTSVCFAYNSFDWLRNADDFVWKETEYNAFVTNINKYIGSYTTYTAAEIKAGIRTQIAYFKKIMTFFNNIFTDLWKGFKLNNGSTITEFTAQKTIISNALRVIQETESWMNGTS